MQFAIVLASFLSLASAAAVDRRDPAILLERQAGVCGPTQTPLCCETDALGLLNLNCANAGAVATTAAFLAQCATTGASAQCCTLPIGGAGLICTGA